MERSDQHNPQHLEYLEEPVSQSTFTVQTNLKAVTIQWAMHFLVFYTWQEDLKMETKVAD